MAHRGGLAGEKHEYMEIGEVNFSWPGHNGTLQDFGAVNYTMPSGDFLTLFSRIRFSKDLFALYLLCRCLQKT